MTPQLNTKKPGLHWLLFLPALMLSIALMACAGSGSTSTNTSSDGTIHIDSKITGYSLDATSVRAGTVTFIIANNDMMPHDFSISGNGTTYSSEMLKPGETETLVAELTAGMYDYVCTMEGHGVMMKGTLEVVE